MEDKFNSSEVCSSHSLPLFLYNLEPLKSSRPVAIATLWCSDSASRRRRNFSKRRQLSRLKTKTPTNFKTS